MTIVFNFWAKPFESKEKANNELFNELSILLVTLLLPMFSDGLEESADMLNITGYVFISIVLLNIAVNFLI